MPLLRLSRGTVDYEVHRRKRRTVGVVVRADGNVEAHAPMRASQREIREVMEEFRPWIERKRREMLERSRRRRQLRFDDGERFGYLGGSLVLRVREQRGPYPRAPERSGKSLTVFVPVGLSIPSRRAVARYAVMRWLLDEARALFHRRHIRCAKRVGRAAVEITIKDMSSRWGSCGPAGKMSINWRLVMAPLFVLDYVLVHELTHMLVPSHSAAFWRRVGKALPDYDRGRDWLREHGDDLEL